MAKKNKKIRLADLPGMRELTAKVNKQGYATNEDLIRQQEIILDNLYQPAGTISASQIKSGPLKWTEFVEITREEFNSLTKEDRSRLKFWFDQWTKPVSSYEDKENKTAKYTYFGILQHKTGITVKDFDWAKFRRRYFKMHPGRYAEYKATRGKGK